MRIEIDDRSGFCFGVVNAISRAEENLAAGELFSLGDIVHNRLEVQRLSGLGLRSVSHSELGGLRGRNLLIRAHGEPPSTYAAAAESGITVIDATCPVVARLQQVVACASAQMLAVGGQVVILGKRGHAEVVGLTGHAKGNAVVVEDLGDLENVDFTRPVYFLSQTTQSLDLFGRMRDGILMRSVNPDKVIVKDTICRQVANREGHLREFASRFDAVVFVSGRKSSNGKVLFEVCRGANQRSYMVEEGSELCPQWFEGISSVGVCGATSTPHWLMEEVAARTREITSIKNRTNPDLM